MRTQWDSDSVLGAWLGCHEWYWGGSWGPLQTACVPSMKRPRVSGFLVGSMEDAGFLRISPNLGFAVTITQASECVVTSRMAPSRLCLDRLCALRGVGGGLYWPGPTGLHRWPHTHGNWDADRGLHCGERRKGRIRAAGTQKDATSPGFLRSLGTFEAGLGNG